MRLMDIVIPGSEVEFSVWGPSQPAAGGDSVLIEHACGTQCPVYIWSASDGSNTYSSLCQWEIITTTTGNMFTGPERLIITNYIEDIFMDNKLM